MRPDQLFRKIEQKLFRDAPFYFFYDIGKGANLCHLTVELPALYVELKLFQLS
jgi:hypothetical protein